MSEMSVTPTRPARRGMPTWLVLMLIVIGLALLIVLPFTAWLFDQQLPPFSIVIDGTEHVYSVHLGALSEGHRAVIAVTVFAVVVALLVAVPIVVATLLATVAIVLVLSIGLPLVMTAALLLAFLSPVLLLVFLARWIWRTQSRPAAPDKTFGPNMAA